MGEALKTERSERNGTEQKQGVGEQSMTEQKQQKTTEH